MSLFLFGRLAKPWISGFGIPTPKSAATTPPPPSLQPPSAPPQALLTSHPLGSDSRGGNKLIQQRKKCVRGQIVLSPEHKAERKPGHMAGFAHYGPLKQPPHHPTPRKQCTRTRIVLFYRFALICTNQQLNLKDTKEEEERTESQTFFFQAFSASWS